MAELSRDARRERCRRRRCTRRPACARDRIESCREAPGLNIVRQADRIVSLRLFWSAVSSLKLSTSCGNVEPDCEPPSLHKVLKVDCAVVLSVRSWCNVGFVTACCNTYRAAIECGSGRETGRVWSNNLARNWLITHGERGRGCIRARGDREGDGCKLPITGWEGLSLIHCGSKSYTSLSCLIFIPEQRCCISAPRRTLIGEDRRIEDDAQSNSVFVSKRSHFNRHCNVAARRTARVCYSHDSSVRNRSRSWRRCQVSESVLGRQVWELESGQVWELELALESDVGPG